MGEKRHWVNAPDGSKRTFHGIQGLRFVAALLVVVTHSMFYANDRLDSEFFVWRGGTVGVDIFFVISGFVMMWTAGPFTRLEKGYRYFAMRRIVRIVPMYWLATTLKIVVVLVAPGAAINSSLSFSHVASSYLFLPTINEAGQAEPILGVGWTLTFEMFFYAIFALALFLRLNVFAFSSVLMIIFAVGHMFRPVEDWPAWAFYFDKVVLYFVAGMAIALFVKSRFFQKWWPWVAGILCLVAVIMVLQGNAAWSRDAWFRTCVVVLVVLLVVAAEPLIARFLPRPIEYLGDASYSLYLFHPLIAPAVPAVLALIGLQSGALSVAGSVVVSILAAVVIYRFVEGPVTARLRGLPYAGKLPSTTRPGMVGV